MSTKEKLLALVKASPEIYSGEKLAQALEVSRTAVWKAIRELEKAGYRFEHTPSGYRYLPSDVLAANEIRFSYRYQAFLRVYHERCQASFCCR